MNKEYVICEKSELVAVAGAVRDSLEGKADSGGGNIKTTKTIYLDWSEDYEGICDVHYVSNGEITTVSSYDGIDTIEAEGGIVMLNTHADECHYSNGFMHIASHSANGTGYMMIPIGTPIDVVLMAKQDGETIYLISSGDQQ